MCIILETCYSYVFDTQRNIVLCILFIYVWEFFRLSLNWIHVIKYWSWVTFVFVFLFSSFRRFHTFLLEHTQDPWTDRTVPFSPPVHIRKNYSADISSLITVAQWRRREAVGALAAAGAHQPRPRRQPLNATAVAAAVGPANIWHLHTHTLLLHLAPTALQIKPTTSQL